ncbi:hypothetical protein [Caenimonas koreensis]|uniref:hypothetical protein n=1 Tax=Caenimonas koreensis TaxID=367474 RepID=UPI003783DDC6
MALGAISAAVLVIGGGSLALLRPGMADARLTPTGRGVFLAVSQAILDGSLPTVAAQRESATAALLDRIDELIAALPPHAQAELSQLITLLASAPGRRALIGLSASWAESSVAEVQQGLQSMRVSAISLRRQAYQALHDIVGGAYFSDSQTWSALGYPGPQKIDQ